MRIFNALVIMVASVLLWMLPVSETIYDFKTYVETDTFTEATGVGVTTANMTLQEEVYDDDTDTIDIASDLATDVPAYSSYNTTSRSLVVSGLTANTTRLLTINYDADSLPGFPAIVLLIDRIPYIWILVSIAFPMAGLFAIFTGRNY